MRILFVVGQDLRQNTSANISHIAYLQGLISNGFKVTVIMAKSRLEKGKLLKLPEEPKYFEYAAYDIFSTMVGYVNRHKATTSQARHTPTLGPGMQLYNLITKLCRGAYHNYLNLIYPDGINYIWLGNAGKFLGESTYDYVVSLFWPPASHMLVKQLINQGRIQTRKWIQIWEDPWCCDIYHTPKRSIQKQEEKLLAAADTVIYVSPLTLEYQKKHFSNQAHKMHCVVLPFLASREKSGVVHCNNYVYGYFGQYHTIARNILPFFEAANIMECRTYIYGDTDLALAGNEHIKINNRVGLEELRKVEDQTDILVHLSNLKGGQIPGKIYQYAGTGKPILFILDGTNEEQQIITDFFSQYNRFFFCKNTVNNIVETMKLINAMKPSELNQTIISEFSPQMIIEKIINLAR